MKVLCTIIVLLAIGTPTTVSACGPVRRILTAPVRITAKVVTAPVRIVKTRVEARRARLVTITACSPAACEPAACE